MWNIIKSLFRYALKHKVWLITLTMLTFLSTAIFSSLMMLSENLSKSYDKLVVEGNLHDGSIHELYSTTVEDEPTLTGDAAKEENKRRFLKELDDTIGEENYRRFNAIDFTTTNSGYAYKIVQSEIDYTMDKLVIYDGQDVLKSGFDFEEIINTADWSSDSLASADARRLLVYLASRAEWTNPEPLKKFGEAHATLKDIERPSEGQPVGQYDPKNNSSSSVSYAKSALTKWLNPDSSTYLPLINKGYRLAFDCSTTIPIVGRFDNFSAYTTVVPEYVLKNHDKQILPPDLYSQYLKMDKTTSTTTQSQYMSWLKAVPNRYKISIDNLEFVIVGTGLSPGFMYPVLNLERSIPNIATEIILYGNNSTFELAFDSNRSSPTDDYLIFKSENMSQALVDELNLIANKYMSWPSNIPAVYFANDTSNTQTAQGVRISFLPNLIKMQVGLSIALSSFIGVLTCIIFLFTVRKFIDDNRSSLTVLRANGIKKRTIVMATSTFGIIPSVVGGILAYIVAQFTQTSLIGLYSTYWIIPTAITLFNPLVFFGVILVPYALMGILSSLLTYFLLRKNVSDLMKDTASFKVTQFAKFFARLFARADIITKFRTSIAFSSMSKLIAITTLFALSSIAITTATAITNKFETAKVATFSAKDYNFAVDLVTPTVQSGQYFVSEFKDTDKPVIDDKGNVLKFNIGMVDNGKMTLIGKPSAGDYNKLRTQNWNNLTYLKSDMTFNQNFAAEVVQPIKDSGSTKKMSLAGATNLSHIPSYNDATWQKTDFMYLGNKSQMPFMVDAEVGALGLNANGWDIARNLAPPNTMIISDNLTKQLWQTILNDERVFFQDSKFLDPYGSTIKPVDYIGKSLNEIYIKKGFLKRVNPQPETDPDSFEFVYKENSTEYGESGWYKIEKTSFKTSLGTALKNDFIVLGSFVTALPDYQQYIFKALYNSISAELDDESYTRVEAELLKGDASSITIKGIKPNSNYIKLKNKDKEDINKVLYIDEQAETVNSDTIHSIYTDETFGNKNNYKMIINESAAYEFELKVGDKVIIDPTNEATRFNPIKVNPDATIDYSKYNERHFEFEIVEIAQTFQYPEFYINQRIANHINAMDHQDVMKTCFRNLYEYDEALGCDVVTVHQTDPFNGIFSNSEEIKTISQTISLYSESGLAPATDKFAKSNVLNNVILETLKSKSSNLTSQFDQAKYLSKMQLARTLGFVNEIDNSVNMTAFEAVYPANAKSVEKVLHDIVSTYGVNPFTSSVYNVEYVEMFSQIFDNISGFINSIMIMVLLILFTISILSVMFLSVEFISSAISVIAILKVLGFYDRTNAFAFLSMFFPAMIIAVAVSVPLTMLVLSALSGFVYNFSSILLPLKYQWWYFVIPSLLLGSILGITIAIAILMLKKQNTTNAIARY
ncbi:MAG: FtsX-like permease family protein [Mycoplasma sp.]